MTKKSTPKTLADFRAAHDPDVIVPNKIRAALAAMEKDGPEQWAYELDFIRLAGLGQAQIAAYRDRFLQHIVDTSAVNGRSPKRVWFATAKAAKAARGE